MGQHLREAAFDLFTDRTRDLGLIGFWSCDFRTQRVHASRDVNRLFGLCMEHDNQGFAMGLYGLKTHPDDAEWLLQGRKRSVGPSGHGVIEYRIIDETGAIRWLMCRGLYEVDGRGELISGHGMVLDVTAFKADGNRILSADAAEVTPLDRFVDLLIEAFAAARQVDDPHLLELARATLLHAGRLLAQRIDQDVFLPPH